MCPLREQLLEWVSGSLDTHPLSVNENVNVTDCPPCLSVPCPWYMKILDRPGSVKQCKVRMHPPAPFSSQNSVFLAHSVLSP